ncbi:hypothetical protein J4710_05980 [Staphylococcus xylosus]|uniref:Uncharacterized protein n=1 Tax=Staphylococcus xylosus TaxID=1288 RepID=A0A939NC61_STAXY|nr:hypothetical protein [Staphylococcus xylosus]
MILYNGGMLADALAHVIGIIVVSAAIVLVGAIVLHPYNCLFHHQLN